MAPVPQKIVGARRGKVVRTPAPSPLLSGRHHADAPVLMGRAYTGVAPPDRWPAMASVADEIGLFRTNFARSMSWTSGPTKNVAVRQHREGVIQGDFELLTDCPQVTTACRDTM